jgi:predicted Zn-dependent protease
VLLAAALAIAGDTAVSRAEALLSKGDFAGAAALLEPATAAGSRDPEAYIMLAVARVNLNQPQAAVEVCERGMAAIPKSARLERYYADLLVETAPKSEIEPRLERALAADPGSAVLQKALGRFLLAKNPQDARAEKLLSNAAGVLANDPDAHYAYGQWACLNQRQAVCIAEMRRALDFTEPANRQARVQANTFIAIAEESLGHADAAGAAYRSALEVNREMAPFNPSAAFLYVKFLLGAAEDAQARSLVEEILKRAPEFAPARFERAKALFRDGSAERAATEAELALQNATSDKTDLRAMHSFLVKTYSVLGREADAARHQAWVEANR